MVYDNITTPRMEQIADDLYAEGWYTISASVRNLVCDRDQLLNALREIAQDNSETGNRARNIARRHLDERK